MQTIKRKLKFSATDPDMVEEISLFMGKKMLCSVAHRGTYPIEWTDIMAQGDALEVEMKVVSHN